jgi:hypothetical protein
MAVDTYVIRWVDGPSKDEVRELANALEQAAGYVVDIRCEWESEM